MNANGKYLFDLASDRVSRAFTRTYSTSFSLAIRCLHKDLHRPIHAIYGYVRLADEVVDSLHDFPKKELLERLRADTREAISARISLNPVLNSFQWAVNTYKIDWELIDEFLSSMQMDLEPAKFDRERFDKYILGSAEVVGLMCLRVFCNGDDAEYQRLKGPAMRLGSAFQKVNFLRDLRADHFDLGRTYFPEVDVSNFSEAMKKQLEADMRIDFEEGLKGIGMLPRKARFGVYLAYVYYWTLFRKITATPATELVSRRIRISNPLKMVLLARSAVRYRLNLM